MGGSRERDRRKPLLGEDNFRVSHLKTGQPVWASWRQRRGWLEQGGRCSYMRETGGGKGDGRESERERADKSSLTLPHVTTGQSGKAGAKRL